MTAHLAQIWRHPIKSHGREALDQVTLTHGQTLPWDRHWAVTHAQTKWDPAAPSWMACANFVLVSSVADLMAIWTVLDDATGHLTLGHPNRPQLSIDPADPGGVAAFLAWIAPLLPQDRQATALVCAPGRGMTDTDYPSVSICNLASTEALGQAGATVLSPHRWRGNLWISGWQAWAETDLIGRDVRIGPVVLHLREPIKRCTSTMANPETGKRDVDTLALLHQHTGAQDFGTYAEVLEGGTIRIGDPVEIVG